MEKHFKQTQPQQNMKTNKGQKSDIWEQKHGRPPQVKNYNHNQYRKNHSEDNDHDAHSTTEDSVFNDPPPDNRHHRRNCHKQKHQSFSTSSTSITTSSSSSSSSSSTYSSSSSFSSSSTATSSSSSGSSSDSDTDSSNPRSRPQHSRSCNDISKKTRYFDHGDDTTPLLEGGENLNRNTKQASTLQSHGKKVIDNGSVRKTKSMESLSRPSKEGQGGAEEEKRKNEARKNVVKEKMKFSAFLNEITRQVLSPMRLTTLGVTNVQRPTSPGQASVRSTKSLNSMMKHEQQKHLQSSADSASSGKRSHGSSKHSHAREKHYSHSVKGSPERQTRRNFNRSHSWSFRQRSCSPSEQRHHYPHRHQRHGSPSHEKDYHYHHNCGHHHSPTYYNHKTRHHLRKHHYDDHHHYRTPEQGYNEGNHKSHHSDQRDVHLSHLKQRPTSPHHHIYSKDPGDYNKGSTTNTHHGDHCNSDYYHSEQDPHHTVHHRESYLSEPRHHHSRDQRHHEYKETRSKQSEHYHGHSHKKHPLDLKYCKEFHHDRHLQSEIQHHHSHADHPEQHPHRHHGDRHSEHHYHKEDHHRVPHHHGDIHIETYNHRDHHTGPHDNRHHHNELHYHHSDRHNNSHHLYHGNHHNEPHHHHGDHHNEPHHHHGDNRNEPHHHHGDYQTRPHHHHGDNHNESHHHHGDNHNEPHHHHGDNHNEPHHHHGDHHNEPRHHQGDPHNETHNHQGDANNEPHHYHADHHNEVHHDHGDRHNESHHHHGNANNEPHHYHGDHNDHNKEPHHRHGDPHVSHHHHGRHHNESQYHSGDHDNVSHQLHGDHENKLNHHHGEHDKELYYHHGDHHNEHHHHHEDHHYEPHHHHKDHHSEPHHHHKDHHNEPHHHYDVHHSCQHHHHRDSKSPHCHEDHYSQTHHHGNHHSDHHAEVHDQHGNHHLHEHNDCHQKPLEEHSSSHFVQSMQGHSKTNQTHTSPSHHGKPTDKTLEVLQDSTRHGSAYSQEEEQTSFSNPLRKESADGMSRIIIVQEQNEGLQQSLLKTAVRVECLGEEFMSSRHCLEADLQRTRLELSNLTEKFERLHDNCSSTQQTNSLLEHKLHLVAQSMQGERERLNQRISALTEKLTDAKFVNSVDTGNVVQHHADSCDDTNPPITPPPAEFMDGFHGKDKVAGHEQSLGSVPEEEESDWSEISEETPRFVLTGLNYGQVWRRRQSDTDRASESGGEEIFRPHSPRPPPVPHLQFTVHNEVLPFPPNDLSDIVPCEGSYKFTASPSLGSTTLFRSASFEDIPLGRHANAQDTEAMMDLHHSGAEAVHDIDNEFIHHLKINRDTEMDAAMSKLQSAERILNHLICETQHSEDKSEESADVQDWSEGIPDELFEGERTKL